MKKTTQLMYQQAWEPQTSETEAIWEQGVEEIIWT
jgi:hypothetical protein